MPHTFETWTPGLVQTGPPPYSTNDDKLGTKRRWFICATIAEMRGLFYHPDNLMVLLLGETQPMDGNLQGFFLAYDPSTGAEDGGSQILANDRRTLWKKIQ